MREIKFRAWHREIKKMLYWQELQGKMLSDAILYTFLGFSIMGPREAEFLDLMQFTGLLDKNGREIYEGDIVSDFSLISAGNNCVIKWGKNECGWLIDGLSGCHHMMGYVNGRYKVIGNIYENPESLLKEPSK